jgi:hypothetical protein
MPSFEVSRMKLIFADLVEDLAAADAEFKGSLGAVAAAQDMVRQWIDILGTVAERLNDDSCNIGAVIEVLAKSRRARRDVLRN